MYFQRTIRKKISIDGVGLHTGQPTKLSFAPAAAGTGIHLVRKDLPGEPSIRVFYDSVQATALATTLGGPDFQVSTVEHCLSALSALRIDNLLIELDGSEVPICDGSAKAFLEAILSQGLVDQDTPRSYCYITQPIYVGDDEKNAYVTPYDGLRISCTIDFKHPSIGLQEMDIDINQTSFSEEVAAARTFGFLKDVEALQAKGLARGGSLENAIVLDDEKIMNPSGLRFSDEFVRHKVLDALGDLVTLGMPLMGHLHLYKAGHDLMNQLVRKIDQSPESFRRLELGGELRRE